MYVIRILSTGLLAFVLGGCAQYDEPHKESKSFSTVMTEGVALREVDGKGVSGSSVRIVPGIRGLDFQNAYAWEPNSIIIAKWHVQGSFVEGGTYKFTASQRELRMTDVSTGRRFRFTKSGACVPMKASTSQPTPKDGSYARILKASIVSVSNYGYMLAAEIEIHGYPNVPLTLQATVVDENGAAFPGCASRGLRVIRTGKVEDVDTYHLDLDFTKDQSKTLLVPAYARLDIVDKKGRLVSTLEDNLDLFIDLR